MACYLYIVEGKDGNLYIGITNNIRRRVEQHNGVSFLPGARYTKSRRPVFLVHVERFTSRKEARIREIEVKKFTHQEKIILIQKTTKADILSVM